MLKMVERWIAILASAVEPAARAGLDEAAQIARRLHGFPADGDGPVDRLHARRREHQVLLAYASILARNAPHPSRQCSSEAPDHRAPPPPASEAPRLIEQMYGLLASIADPANDPPPQAAWLATHNGGTFTKPGSYDQLETWWFHELVLLHGLASYAVLASDAHAWRLLRSAAEFHRAEIQPDHATSDPWAIHAFVLDPHTQDVADSLLNACMVQYGGEPRGVALVLLADALYCLRHVAKHGHPEPV